MIAAVFPQFPLVSRILNATACRQGRAATCPMCSATVQLTIQWRLPFGRRADDEPPPPADSDDEDGGGGGGAGAQPGGAGGGGMFPEIQVRLSSVRRMS